MMNVLDKQDLDDWLGRHKKWSYKNGEITTIRNFKSFMIAHDFIRQVANLAEEQNHHPRIENSYTKVVLAMNTHDADNQITKRDIKLAEAIEELE